MAASVNQLQAAIHRKKGRTPPKIQDFLPEPFQPKDVPPAPKQTPDQMKEAFIGAMKAAGVDIVYKKRYDPQEDDDEDEDE